MAIILLHFSSTFSQLLISQLAKFEQFQLTQVRALCLASPVLPQKVMLIQEELLKQKIMIFGKFKIFKFPCQAFRHNFSHQFLFTKKFIWKAPVFSPTNENLGFVALTDMQIITLSFKLFIQFVLKSPTFGSQLETLTYKISSNMVSEGNLGKLISKNCI